MQRPLFPRINRRAPLGGGLLFAALGGGASTNLCVDASGYGNHGILVATEPDDWQFDSYLGRWKVTYDGSAEYVDLLAKSRRLLTGLKAFSFSAWIKTTQTDRATLFGMYNTSTTPFYTIDINRGSSIPDAGKIYAVCRRASTSNDISGYTTSDTVVNDGSWHHVSVIIRLVTNSIDIYVDGVSLGVTYVQQLYSSVGVSVAKNLFIAGLDNAGSLDVPFAGSLSDVLIHGRALTLPEIQILTKPDPWLGGLILQPTRKLWPVAVGGAPPATGNRRRRFIITGAYR